MQPQLWERVKSIFNDALTVDPEARAGFVEHASNGDAELQRHVMSLLDAHDDATEFLETPAVALIGEPPPPRDFSPPTRDRIGPYRLLHEIGRGGMGAVFLATRDDGQFAQRVAVKLIKRGMDTDDIVARFRRERQIVAALEHPNIARLLDGGSTDDGVPYFVMEYVEGQSIQEYCRVRKLDVRQRLQLFRSVCDAVQFAHRNLVVHRDIKNSNIIVTKDGVPKLLDFGIAKVLQMESDEARTLTAATVAAMTPEYASPEQLRGEPVTTSTDVYSLGVLLYELLAGSRPVDVSGLRGDDLVRAVSDTQPRPPSIVAAQHSASSAHRSASGEITGELDTIVLMALRKEPSRRYSSVERFGEDIDRYLSNRPVSAERDTLQYRFTKFAQRNRASLLAGSVVAATLFAGVVATLWQARVAERERVRAERRFSEIRSLATQFIFDVHDSIAPLAGATPVRAMLVKQGLASLDGLMKESAGDTLLERELSAAYQRMGAVQGNSYYSNLGESEAALASYRTAVQLLERSTDSTSRNTKALMSLALAHRGLADMLGIVGNTRESLEHLEVSRGALRRVLALDSTSLDGRRALADLSFVLGDTYGGFGLANVGETDKALISYRQSIAMREQIMAQFPKDEENRAGLANVLVNLGSLLLSLDDSTGNVHLARGVAIHEQQLADSPNNAERKNSLLSGYLRQRRPLADAGRFAEAMIIDRKVLVILEAMANDDPENSLLQRNLGVTYNTLGFDLLGAGHASESVVQYRKGMAIASRLASDDPASLEMKQDLAFTHAALGNALRESNQNGAAIAEFDRGVALKVALLEKENENSRHPGDLAHLYASRGMAYTAMNRFDAAQRDFSEAVTMTEKLVADSSATNRTRNDAALLYGSVGHLHVVQAQAAGAGNSRVEHCAQAKRWLSRSLDAWNALEAKRQLSGANRGKPASVRGDLARCSS